MIRPGGVADFTFDDLEVRNLAGMSHGPQFCHVLYKARSLSILQTGWVVCGYSLPRVADARENTPEGCNVLWLVAAHCPDIFIPPDCKYFWGRETKHR